MNGYTKLFSSIITSTIWQEDDKTRILWITMLALSDANGTVEGSIPGLARMAGISLESCEASMVKLLSPDSYSRSKDHEGRRIVEVDGGWFILNRAQYRDKKVSRADYFRKYRKKKSATSATSATCCTTPLQQFATQEEKEKENYLP